MLSDLLLLFALFFNGVNATGSFYSQSYNESYIFHSYADRTQITTSSPDFSDINFTYNSSFQIKSTDTSYYTLHNLSLGCTVIKDSSTIYADYRISFNVGGGFATQSQLDWFKNEYGENYFVTCNVTMDFITQYSTSGLRKNLTFSITQPLFDYHLVEIDDSSLLFTGTTSQTGVICYTRVDWIIFEYLSTDSYQAGYERGFDDGETYGHQIGYAEGLNEQDIWRLDNYLFAIADIPFMVMRQFFNDSLFGGPGFFVICMSLVTAAIVIGIIRRFI